MASLEKAMFFDPDDPRGSCVYVQFNPNTLDYSYGKRTHKKGGEDDKQTMDQQSPLDVTAQARLSMRLFFNTYASPTSYTDVREELLPLRGFLCRTEDRETVHAKGVMFAWGTLAYRGTMDSFSVTYQMFAADGTPVQAEVSLSISGEDAQLGADAPARRQAEETDRGEELGWLFDQ